MSAGILGPVTLSSQKLAIDDMHVDFAGGAHAGRGTPCELVGGRGFGKRDQLLRDVPPFAVVSLPQTVEGFLGEQATCGEKSNGEHEQASADFHGDLRG